MAYDVLKQTVQNALPDNIENLISAADVRNSLIAVINSLGSEFQFGGVAEPDDKPGTPDYKVAYIASTTGTYTNFGGITLADGEVAILKWAGSWSKEVTGLVNPESVFLVERSSPYSDPDVLSYITDADGRIFAILHKDGSVERLALTSEEKEQKKVLDMVSSPSIHDDENVLKYFTDEDNRCFGYLRKDGTVVIHKAKIGELDGAQGGEESPSASEALLSAVIGILSTGLDGVQMSKNPKMMAALNNIDTQGVVLLNATNNNKMNLGPKLSIIDDDTIDFQIPSSRGEATFNPAFARLGGFFSLLLPVSLSLQAKHGINAPVGVACEGQRVGLTKYRSSDDTYSELNANGLAVKFLHDRMGWNVFNHSMTAQLPQRSFFVDGIDSELADTILAQGYYEADLSFENTMVIDRLTGKWYEVNSTKTSWVERTPTKKYAQPFYYEYINADDPTADHKGQVYFNRDFDFEYSWGQWFKRADALGLPYERVIVHNGQTTSVYTIYAGRKFADFSVNTKGIYNYPPIAASVARTTAANAAGNNVWNDAWVDQNLNILQECVNNKYWVVYMSHVNERSFRNYYEDGQSYPAPDPTKPALRGYDANYPSEWIIPLNHEEIQDIIGENVHDYINHPPERLGITSWADWHPAGGTQLAAFYYILDQAASLGIEICSPMDGWKTHGNILNLGVDRNGQTYNFDSASAVVPYTDGEKSFVTIGADMSIRVFNSKRN